MNQELQLRKATIGDTPRILEIIAHAKAQMKAHGSAQWQDGYPAAEDIARDISRGDGWVLCRPMEKSATAIPTGTATTAPTPIAYGALLFDGEPAYAQIEGRWLSPAPYVVVHRLAVADGEKGRGVAAEFMLRVGEIARARGIGGFRIDTNFDNEYMLRLLHRQGFVYCGKIQYQSSERLAFEKEL